MNYLLKISRVAASPLLILVQFYQKTLSPDHGLLKNWFPQGYCRYYPSCSEYAREALHNTGIIALPVVVWRLMRCHPWSNGGIDPYPHQHVPNNSR
ncbi:MAG: membrane protein insertion efficiency factor YidD [Parcubacteria group bacterium]